MRKAWVRGFLLQRFPRGRPAGRLLRAALAVLALALPGAAALAQTYDCAGLQAKIADLDRSASRPAGGSGPSRQQVAQLSQLISTARGLGCDRPEIAFSGGAGGRCPGLNAQIAQLQASVGAAQAAGSPADRAAARADLVARFNAYCKNQPPAPTPPARLLRAAVRHSGAVRDAAPRAGPNRRSAAGN